nr:MAG: cellulose-binding protein [Pseudomonadota bacterium]
MQKNDCVRALFLSPRLTATALIVALAGCTGEIDATPGMDPGNTTPNTNGNGPADPPTSPGSPSTGSPPAGAPTTSPTGGTPTTPPDPGSEPGTPGPSAPTDPTLPDPMAQACAESNGVLNVGLTKLRRLTRDQLDNTVRDLLGVTGDPGFALGPEGRLRPFHTTAIAPITDLIVQQHQEIAADLAVAAQARMNEIAPCDLAADSGTTCATEFVETFGMRAFRRPLEPSEVADYVELYRIGHEGGGAANGFRLVVEAMLQSPFFLYHSDVGVNGAPSATPVPVTPFELASRLSYFLWNSMPDTELFERAKDGSLVQEAVITAQVERMLADPRAGQTIALFHRQWLGFDDLEARDKDPDAFPEYGPELTRAMLAETARFTDYVVRQGDGLLRTLFTADFTFPDAALLPLYGVTAPPGFTDGARVQLDATQRSGILTQAAFLTRHAHREQTSPVLRGIMVRENLLCQPIPPPPAAVNNAPPPASSATTTRERYAQHVEDPACATCHSLIDPLGLAFEHYDPIGRYRVTDGAGEVDASGEVTGVSADLSGPFQNGIELVQKLAASKDVADCVANQWIRFSLGRMESKSDACSVQRIHEDFRATGNIRRLLTQIALSDTFRHVRSTGGEEN